MGDDIYKNIVSKSLYIQRGDFCKIPEYILKNLKIKRQILLQKPLEAIKYFYEGRIILNRINDIGLDTIKNFIEVDENLYFTEKLFSKHNMCLKKADIKAITYAMENELDFEILDKITNTFVYSLSPRFKLYGYRLIFSPEQIIEISNFYNILEDKDLTKLLLKTNSYQQSITNIDNENEVKDFYKNKNISDTLKYKYPLFTTEDIYNLRYIFEEDKDLGLSLIKLNKEKIKTEKNEELEVLVKEYSSTEIKRIKDKLKKEKRL